MTRLISAGVGGRYADAANGDVAAANSTLWIAGFLATMFLLSAAQVFAYPRAGHPFDLRPLAGQGLYWSLWLGLAPGIVWLVRRTTARRQVPYHLLLHGLAAGTAILLLSLLFFVANRARGFPPDSSAAWRIIPAIASWRIAPPLATYAAVALLATLLETTSRPSAWRDSAREDADQLRVKDRGQIVVLKVGEIQWIAATDYCVTIHTPQRQYVVRETIARIHARLDPTRFVRVHRSTVVNRDAIHALDSRARDPHVVLADGTKLRVAASRRATLMKCLEFKRQGQRTPAARSEIW